MNSIKRLCNHAIIAIAMCLVALPSFAVDSASFNPAIIPISTKASSSGVPVGTIVAWPVSVPNQTQCVSAVSEEDAQARGCEWLVCDGSNITPSAYPALTAMVGGSLPNYKGMFLRGHGSQNHSQNNGSTVGVTSTSHSSGNLGAVQGDAIRKIEGKFHAYSMTIWGPATGGALYAHYMGGYGSVEDSRLGNHGINLDSSRIVPTASENRPVNRAVHYLIKAY